MKKKIVFIALVFAIAFNVVGAYGQNASNPGAQIGNFLNSIFGNSESSSSSADSDFEMNGTTLVKYNGKAANVTIPSNVTAIGEKAFSECDSIKSVTIPSSVISIGNEAFNACVNLTSVNILSGLKTIGNWAFSSCGKLTNITIPSSVTSIGNVPFGSCAGLTGITVDAQNITYSSVDGVLFNKAKTNLISYPNGKKGNNYTIPSGVTSIEDWAFCFCNNLTGITIPPSVTSIGDYAFAFCDNITSITIPATVTSVGEQIFFFSNVKTVTLSRNTRIADNTFSDDVRIIYSDSAPAAVQPDKAAYDRGREAYDQKNYDRAITEFTEAIRLNPNYELAFYFRAEAYTIKEDYDKALADFTQAIRLSPNDTDNYNERGYVYIIRNDFDRAIADFNQTLKIDPNNTDAKEGLELARQRKQNSTPAAAPARPAAPPVTTSANPNVIPPSAWTLVGRDSSVVTRNISTGREVIEGQERDVLTLEVNFGSGVNKVGVFEIRDESIVSKLRMASGVRFKALGDGKRWLLRFETTNLSGGDAYQAELKTVYNRVVDINIPFSSLKQTSDWTPSRKGLFVKGNIINIIIERRANPSSDTGFSTLKVFDFEVY